MSPASRCAGWESRKFLTIQLRTHTAKQLALAELTLAAVLGLHASSIALHRKHIMRKLDLHSQVDLMRYAIEKGFAQI